MKTRQEKNRINSLIDASGQRISEPAAITKVILDFYGDLLGSFSLTESVGEDVFRQGHILTKEHGHQLLALPTPAEIKGCLWSFPDTKGPGPDGYNFGFFKKAWHVIGDEVCTAVSDFFLNGKLLKSINSTVITLVAKVENPSSIQEYRPIAC